MFKVIIAGGRDFGDFELLTTRCDLYLQDVVAKTKVEVVCGQAKGADALGKQYAQMRGYPVKSFPADWNLHGKAAGPIRNEQMAKYANALIAFWDGESRGTKNMIDLAHANGLVVRVVRY